MKRFKKISLLILNWLPTLVWMGLIFYLSSIPNLKTELETIYDMILRKGAHMFEYFVLSLLIWFGLRKTKIWNTTKLQIIFIVSLLYAFSDEFHQSLVATRSGNIKDVGVDAIGIVIAIVFIKILQKRKK